MPKETSIKIPHLIARKLFYKKDQEGFGDKSWAEYFNWLTKDVTLTETELDLVKKSTHEMLGQWMQNFSNNLPYIRFGDDTLLNKGVHHSNNISDLKRSSYLPKRSAIVIGRGPSIFQHKHLETLSEAINQGYHGLILATDGMLIESLKHNIVPDFTVTLDGSSIIKKWFNHPLVKKHGSQLKVLASVTIHHDVYQIIRKVGGSVYWFYPIFDDYRNIQSFTNMQRFMTKAKLSDKPLGAIEVGGNAGTCAWIIAVIVFKCVPVALIGIDFSYPKGIKLEDTPYFSGVLRGIEEAKTNLSAIRQIYETTYHPFFKTYAQTDVVFRTYRKSFLKLAWAMPKWFNENGGTINCSEGGVLFGPLITCMYFKDFLDVYNL